MSEPVQPPTREEQMAAASRAFRRALDEYADVQMDANSTDADLRKARLKAEKAKRELKAFNPR